MADIDPGFTKPPAGFSGPSKNIDPGFTAPPKGFTGPSKNIDPGFTAPPKTFAPKQSVRPATPADRGSSSNRSVGGGIASTLFNNAKGYVTNLGRSVRDVPTALGTALDSKGAQARGERFAATNPTATSDQVKSMARQPIKNIGNQVGDVIQAIAGKKDTSRSDQYMGADKKYISVNGNPGPLKNSK